MTAIAQLTVAILGAGWAVLTLSDVRYRVAGPLSVTCFVLAVLSLVFSLFVYQYGHEFLVARQQPVRMENLKLEYATDLQIAGAMAKVSMSDGVIGAFGEAASLQSESFTRIYLSVPKQQRVTV